MPPDSRIPRSKDPAPLAETTAREHRILEEVVMMMEADLDQNIEERNQRMRIGARITAIVVLLSLCLFSALWFFVHSIPANGSESVWQFAALAFSATYIAVAALLFALIKSMFWQKNDNSFSLSMIGEIKSLMDKLRNK